MPWAAARPDAAPFFPTDKRLALPTFPRVSFSYSPGRRKRDITGGYPKVPSPAQPWAPSHDFHVGSFSLLCDGWWEWPRFEPRPGPCFRPYSSFQSSPWRPPPISQSHVKLHVHKGSPRKKFPEIHPVASDCQTSTTLDELVDSTCRDLPYGGISGEANKCLVVRHKGERREPTEI